MTVHIPEYRWVHRIPLHFWDSAPDVLVDIDLVVPTQTTLHLEAYLKVLNMIKNAGIPKDAVLLVKYKGDYLIRDGHHRYAVLMGRSSEFMAGKVYYHV